MTKTATIRVLIADDNKVVRRGLRMRLEGAVGIVVIGEAGSGPDAVVTARAERADVVLMDLHMPDRDGVEATRALTGGGKKSRPRVLIMTSDPSDNFVVDALQAGASGYLLKNHDFEQIADIIRGVVRGDSPISPSVTPRLVRELNSRQVSAADRDALTKLSAAERRAVELLSGGLSNDDIAVRLKLSVNTVRSQLAAAMKKVGVENRTHLALWGSRAGLRPPSA